MTIKENCSIKEYTTFGIDARVRMLVEAESTDEIREILEKHSTEPLFILGGGSNIVFTSDFNGIILHPTEKNIEIVREDDEFTTIRVSAGVEWDSLVDYTVNRGWGGIENLSLIPGNVGACPVQNIGAYGVEVKDVITKVEGISIGSLESLEFTNEDCQFGYRDSIFKGPLKGKIVITHVTFRLSKKPTFKTHYGNIEEELTKYPQTTIKNIREAVINIRERKLPSPKDFGNCGSFFKNPTVDFAKFEEIKGHYPNIPSFPAPNNLVKIPAAWLIETCGFKGIKRGNVGVHSQQALVIINLGNATGCEVIQLADDIIRNVQEHFGIELEKEVNVL